ncbi:MAG: homoserine O-acetyltransferase [Planctomycetota bacterium]
MLKKTGHQRAIPKDETSVGPVRTVSARLFTDAEPLTLQSGATLAPVDVAYQTYGRLNADRSNAVFICHALTGSAHAAGYVVNASGARDYGWWETSIGPGKSIDTDRFFVVCANILGSCYGTTGPTSVNPSTGKAYCRTFPIITIEDMVRVQQRLMSHLGVERLACVIGGSLGGMQALEWSIRYPQQCGACIIIASAAAINAQAIAWDAIGRQAILTDANYRDGHYADESVSPTKGLAIARMIGHITYLSDEGLTVKFGRALRHSVEPEYNFASEFSVETYLDHQGEKFVRRFDANSYLYITKAMDYYDLSARFGNLNDAFKSVNARYLVVSYSSDTLFPPYQSQAIVRALMSNDKEVTYIDIPSDYGHDAFLVETQPLGEILSSFLGGEPDDAASGEGAR